MSIMSLLSIEKKREECFVLVGGVHNFGVIVRSSPHIMKYRFDWWEDLMENSSMILNLQNIFSLDEASVWSFV